MREHWQNVLDNPRDLSLLENISDVELDYAFDSARILNDERDYTMRDSLLSSIDDARMIADGDESVFTDPRSILRNGNPVFDVES